MMKMSHKQPVACFRRPPRRRRQYQQPRLTTAETLADSPSPDVAVAAADSATDDTMTEDRGVASSTSPGCELRLMQ